MIIVVTRVYSELCLKVMAEKPLTIFAKRFMLDIS